jgi:Na+/H+ antiporter NhaC
MLAGMAPTVIYFGLGILEPSWFYPAALIICALTAVSIGSSWTTAGIVGLALIPWNTCGAFMAATLGVPTLAYAPNARRNQGHSQM